MCGRYYTEVDREEMQNIIDAINRALVGNPNLAKMKTGEVRPTNIAPVYINANAGPAPSLMQWGFPGYKKPGSLAKPSPIINARSETVKEKPLFNRYLSQRCLVPASLYFEWAMLPGASDGKKARFAFRPSDESRALFWMAAIYRYTEEAPAPVFTILTMNAAPAIAPLHDRMPVILGTREARRAWMQGETDITGLFRDGAVRAIEYERAG